MAKPSAEDEPIRCVVVDDHAEVLAAIESLLEADGIEVVGRATSGEAALQLELSPSAIVVTDLRLRDTTGLDVARAIIAKDPSRRIVLYATSLSPRGTAVARKIGIRGVLMKQSLREDLSKAIRTVAAGDTYVDPRVPG